MSDTNNPFENLPPLKMLEEDFGANLTRLKQGYKDGTGVFPMNAHPDTFLLEQFAYEANLLRELINEESRQNLLALAKGERLDYLGNLIDTPRLQPRAARSMIRFVLDAHPAAVTIPVNTHIRAADGDTLFKTLEAQTAAVDQDSIDITVECETPGVSGNGFAAGEITELIGNVPWVLSAANTTVSSGGATTEQDEPYRLRIHLAPAKFSTAGSEDSYIYFIRSAHQDVIDAQAWTPDPMQGRVYVCPLIKGGTIPDAPMQALILDAISAKKVRPLTDSIIWTPPEAVPYQMQMTLQINASHVALAGSTKTEAEARLLTLANTWRETLGQDIVPEAMIEQCQKLPGVHRAIVPLPVYTELQRHEFPDCTDITVSVEVLQTPL